MIRALRTTASLLVAVAFTGTALVWLQVPHNGPPNPGRELGMTYDGAVGMIDLYLRHDIRGYQRLADIDPQLNGIGGRAARAAATDHRVGVEDRVAVARRLSTQSGGLTAELARSIVASAGPDELAAFHGFDHQLDVAISEVFNQLDGESVTLDGPDSTS